MAETDSLRGSSILVDACFFLDANSQPRLFGEFILKLKNIDVSFVAIDFAKTEFVRTKSKTDLQAKLDYFGKVVDAILPVDKVTESLMPGLIEEYGDDLDGVSTVDLYLGATIKRYKKLWLLTCNHKDFPTSVFVRHLPVNFELPKAVKTYAFYQYKPSKEEVEVSPF